MIRFAWLTLACFVFGLSACVSVDVPGAKDTRPIIYYMLEDSGRVQTPAATPAAKTLVLMNTLTAPFYDTDGMAFSKEPGTRGYYQFARWAERPGKRFTSLLMARLEQEKLFEAVAQTGTNVRGDWLLTTEIVDFYHDAAKQPGSIKLVLRADVSDLASRKLIARKFMTQSIPIASYDASGAYRGFNQATTLILDEIADWLRNVSVAN